jgi:hypothetical protein
MIPDGVNGDGDEDLYFAALEPVDEVPGDRMTVLRYSMIWVRS